MHASIISVDASHADKWRRRCIIHVSHQAIIPEGIFDRAQTAVTTDDIRRRRVVVGAGSIAGQCGLYVVCSY